ncbi:hypothetical protein L7F22_067557 [Adiantum nelumboides]|nr:hypothetical protein [Adiantum nelumboides]
MTHKQILRHIIIEEFKSPLFFISSLKFCSSSTCKGTRKDPILPRKPHFREKGAGRDATLATMQIYSVCQQGLVEEAYRVFKEMKAMDMVATGDALYMLVGGLALIGHLEDAYSVSVELKGMGAINKKTIYSALITGLSRSGHVEQFEKCCKEGQASGLRIPMKAFNAVINCLVKSGLARKAYDLYLMLKAKGRHPDAFILDSLILLGQRVVKLILHTHCYRSFGQGRSFEA